MTFKSVTSKSLGHLKSFTKSDIGITGVTDHGHFRIIIYSPSVICVGISADEQFEDFSYSVVASPKDTTFDLKEDLKEIVISTSETKLVCTKNPVRFKFTDLHGNIINEDDAGLGTAWIGDQSTTYKKLQEGERFIGLGEKTGPLDRKGSGYQNWNTDAYAYHSGTDPLYCSTPFYIGLHHQQVYGIFFDNTHKTFFNFGASNNRFSSFSADAGEMNYYFINGKNVGEIIQHYTWLTGRMELPPLWSIAYQQCRYSYYPDTEVLSVARTFREKNIPADTIVFDIHYMDKYKIFTWDSKNFADPKGMIDTLKEMGFEVVIMCDPGIKIEEGYEPYDDGVAKNTFIKYPDGENYAGQVWPGWCHFPDFTNPTTREWWAQKFKDYVAIGVEGFWNDMNEIATWGNALPENIEFHGRLGGGSLDAFKAVEMANEMAKPFGTVNVTDRILYRNWFYKLETAPFEIKMSNNLVTDGSKIKFFARNNIEVLSGDYKPDIGYVDLQINPSLSLNCSIPANKINAETNNKNILNSTEVKLYPNPNTGLFTVSVSQKDVKDLNIELFDVFGKSVFKTISNNVNTEINIQNLANGIYLVRLTSNGLSEVLKFIKN